MTKADIDQYFTTHEKDIKQYITARFHTTARWSEEVDYFFTEIYLFLLKRLDVMHSVADIKNFISNFIYMHTYWTNTHTREMGSVDRTTASVCLKEELHDIPTTYSWDTYLSTDVSNEDIHALSMEYYKQLTSPAMKASWEIVFVHKCSSHRKYASYIGRSRTIAERCLRELKEDMMKFYEARLQLDRVCIDPTIYNKL